MEKFIQECVSSEDGSVFYIGPEEDASQCFDITYEVNRRGLLPATNIIEVGSRWRHEARVSTYTVLGICTIEEDLTPGVVYQGDGGAPDTVWVRSMSEFLDGRFIKIERDNNQDEPK